MSHYKRIVLASRPVGDIEPNTFRTEKHPVSALVPGDGEVLVQVTYLSCDPAQRGYIRDVRSYLPPVQIGETMRAQGLGVVIKVGKGSTLNVGQTVTGAFGWTEFAVMKEQHVDKITVPKGVQAIDFLNTLGMSGLTAYFGIRDICQIKPGETVIVSGAAGSVGSVACQLARRAGAGKVYAIAGSPDKCEWLEKEIKPGETVIVSGAAGSVGSVACQLARRAGAGKVYAIAGSPDKCEWLEKEVGVDRALNYKSKTFYSDLKGIGYIDVYFDNVGGDLLDMVLTRLNKGARIALCGAISQYNATKPKGLQNYLTLISQRATLRGFIILDYVPEFPAAIEELAVALVDGSIKRKFHIVDGLEQAPVALPWLFAGKNEGKLLVKVSDEPKAKL
uniref:Enoyl reductase (ER) domain-containing protein n=1 Tax=Mycena chlorophos TaxID=658473 RepID=A0ABQ0MCG6_MYCCL|nr:predicted protein [Mycena chlorophos]